jgi:hypothetical protein
MSIATKAWVTDDARVRNSNRMDRKWFDVSDTYDFLLCGRKRTRFSQFRNSAICLHNSISDGLNAFTLLHCLGSEKFVRI